MMEDKNQEQISILKDQFDRSQQELEDELENRRKSEKIQINNNLMLKHQLDDLKIENQELKRQIKELQIKNEDSQSEWDSHRIDELETELQTLKKNEELKDEVGA